MGEGERDVKEREERSGGEKKWLEILIEQA